MFSWDDVRFLVALCETGSFAGAAARLRVEHSTVRRRIAALEATLGIAVVAKHGGRYVATPAGRDVLTHGERMAASAEAIRREGAVDGAGARGLVRITTVSSLASTVMPRALAACRRRHPNMQWVVTTENRLLSLTNREVDLAIRLIATDKGGLASERLGAIAHGVYAAPSYVAARGLDPASPDLSGHDLLAYDDWFIEQYSDFGWLERHCPNAEIVFRCDCFYTLLAMAEAGMGLVVLPRFIANRVPALVSIDVGAALSQDVWLAFHRDLAESPRLLPAMAHIRDAFVRNAPFLAGETALAA